MNHNISGIAAGGRKTCLSAACLIYLTPFRLRAEYERGGKGYAEMKQQLFELLEETFGEARVRYNEPNEQ